jgi:hypothetical protein
MTTGTPHWAEPPSVTPAGRGDRRSLAAQVVYGAIAGGILGLANGLALCYVLGAPGSAQDSCAWGAVLGAVGGMAGALIQRAVWGGAGRFLGTALEMLYGLVPGTAAVCRLFVVQQVIWVHGAALWFLGASMVGLLVGGVFDRFFDAVVGSRGHLPDQPAGSGAAADRPGDGRASVT